MNHEEHKRELKCEVINDSFQNYKKYAIRPAQLVIADIPYNLGGNFYANRPDWYIGGIIRTAKARTQRKQLFTVTTLLILLNIGISAISY